MAQELREGQTGTAPDGTRVVVRNGQIVPVDAPPATGPEAAGFTSLGDGWYRGPDGGSYQVGRGGAMVQRSEGNGGEAGGDSALKAAADLRGRLVLSLGSTSEANQRMENIQAAGYSFNDDWGARTLEAIPFDGGTAARVVGGDDYQQLETASRSFESAMLPVFSGAAVTESEARRFIRANLPALGDSASTLDTKARNRRLMLNGAATLLGQDIPYPDLGVFGAMFGGAEQEMPYGAAAAVAADKGLTGGGGPSAGPDQGPPAGPGFTPDSPVDISGLSASDLMALQPGQYIKFPDGRVERLSGAPRLGAEGDEVAPGVFQNREPGAGQAGVILGADQAFARSALEQFPLADEAMAGFTSLMTGNDYGDVREAQGALADLDRQNQPIARNMGGVAGATALVASPLGAPVRATRGATLAGRTVNRAVGGAIGGTAWGFGQGQGNALDRLDEAGQGALFGGVAGPAAPVAANALGRVVAPVIGGVQALNRAVARPIVNALGDAVPTPLREAVQANPLASGMNRFAARSPQNVNALTGEAARYRAEEIAPVFADVINDGGRGTMRALATRQTPARESARGFAEGRAAGLQDRVSTQARRTISDDPRQPARIREEITGRRNRQADQQFGAVRGDRISPDREILEALRTPAMRPAIEEAATSAANRGDMETAGMLRNLAGDAMDYGADAQITVGMADRIARSLNGRAEALKRAGNNDAAASHFALAERLRGGARQQVPGYDDALKAYGQDSGLAAATELGEQFMTMEADAFAAAVSRLSPDEQQIARAAARRAVERQAGTQGNAPGVAQRLANGREQGARTAALVGDAAPVQRAMGAELQTLRNAQAVNPAQGSQTSQNLQDAAGAIGVGRDVATGNVLGLAGRAMNAIRARGFNDAEAEAVVTAAIDPARTDELIRMLSERMSRREARSLARAIRYQLTTGPQSGQQP